MFAPAKTEDEIGIGGAVTRKTIGPSYVTRWRSSAMRKTLHPPFSFARFALQGIFCPRLHLGAGGMSNQTLSVIPLDPDLYHKKRRGIVPVTTLVPLQGQTTLQVLL